MRKNEIYRIKEYEDPKRALSKNARVLEQERDLSSLKKLQSLATVLSIITVVGGIGGVLFHSINILGGTGILVSVASLFLCLWKPAYCSLYGEEAYGVPMVSVEGPLFFSTLMLTFLCDDAGKLCILCTSAWFFCGHRWYFSRTPIHSLSCCAKKS